jgi:hypothetical protein
MANAMLGVARSTDRNTKSIWVRVAGVDVLFSYETPVAFVSGDTRLRRHNTWGPTTGRHMSETHTNTYPAVNEDEFNAALNSAIIKSCLERVTQTLEKK